MFDRSVAVIAVVDLRVELDLLYHLAITAAVCNDALIGLRCLREPQYEALLEVFLPHVARYNSAFAPTAEDSSHD